MSAAVKLIFSSIFAFNLTPLRAYGASCCLRSNPLESLADGIQLQSLLLANRQEKNKVSLINEYVCIF